MTKQSDAQSAAPKRSEGGCPPGYRPWSKDPEHKCIARKHPEPPFEIELRQREWIAPRSAPFERTAPGAFGNALRERDAVQKKPPKVNGTDGVWTPYGSGPLINNSDVYPSTSGLGLVHVAGRIDNFAYDSDTNRLFATKGTGGIWLSDDLGQNWRSIGDKLPSQIVAAVAWSKANGGTLVALSGDPALGSYTYTGFGAFYSRDLGQTWTKALGLPDGAPGFAIEIDPANQHIVYAATLVGLFRSVDAGASYKNVVLPTGNCAGVEGGTGDFPQCHLVSTDNGATWTSLVTTAAGGSGTSAVDPIGTVGALGGVKKHPNGLTGSSGSAPNYSGQAVNAPQMTEHTADFTAYAGRTVLLRFGYSSDAGTDWAGFYIDDVRIVNLLGNALFSDDMEVNAQWSLSGTPGFRWVTRSASQ